ncbi:MAG: MBL fold metallo-hydrolase [Chloroflexota bacterium]|nr:MBL fold metallo-hydrolase [Chloroflexota bacterium]
MSARLTVLGGSAAGVGTGQGCSGYYVEYAGTRIVLDLGPATLLELRKHTDFRTLDGVVISHLHLDHILDLFAMRFALTYNPQPPSRRTPLWLPPGGRTMLAGVASLFAAPGELDTIFSNQFEVAEFDPDQALCIGDVRLSFAPTVHYVPCWAIRVTGGESGDLVYTADTGPAADLAGICRGAEVLIAEATLLTPDDEPWDSRGHLTADEAAELAKSADAQTLVLTHIWEEMEPQRLMDRAAQIFPGRLERAQPGLTLRW